MFLVLLLAVSGGLLLERQAVLDWWHLRGYTPPADVAQLASDDTMTSQAKHLFYVNKPDVSNGKMFTDNCPTGSEKTVVLGCYIGNDHGIFVYAITDSRLNGVEQVTAAHEMLHAAYRRLSSGERAKIDALLLDYYQHDLTDQRIKDTIEAYKTSEPKDVVNEMHSIFGTEIADLPVPLQQYYQRYFIDRGKVTSYTASYEGEFASRQAQIASYDAQLKSMNAQIQANESDLTAQKVAIDTQSARMQSERASGQIAAYNAEVTSYNRAVDAYNTLLVGTKNMIKQYNSLVDARNAIALEEQQLTKELSASSLPQ